MCGNEAAGVARNEDFLMYGALIFLAGHEKLLIEFFAWSDTGEDDVDISTHLQTRKLDHITGQIYDLDRFTHIQCEYLTSLPQCRRLQHQLDCLGDGHEITAYFGMCYGDRTASSYLLLKGQHNTAPAA